MRNSIKLISAAITFLYTGFVYADDLTPFPFYPRVNLYGGAGSNTYGRVDAMIPFFGSTDGIIYTDIDAQRGSSSNNYLSLGFGGRDAINEDFLWGGYIFADRISSNIDNVSNKWTVFNPGIEYMTNYWDGRLNLYIPTTDQQTVRTGLYGDQVNQPESISFSGHNQYSFLFNDIQEIGPGADLDFGLTLPQWNRFRIHAGGYYFSPKDATKVHGGEMGAEYPINNYLTAEAIDTYDNVQNNKFLISLRVTLGGADKSSTPTVQDRLLDPVYHNFAGVAQSTVVPIGEQIAETDQRVLEKSNIWFFSPSGSTFNLAAGTTNCTYEHPCAGSQFNQQTLNGIDGIAANANIYLAQGTYSNLSNNLTINEGQSIFGRTPDYTLAAGPGKVQLVGNLILESNTSLNNLWLYNDGTESVGISANSTTGIVLNNIIVGAFDSSQGYATGIDLLNSSEMTINNSTIYAYGGNSPIGINNSANAMLTINNSAIYASTSGTLAYGIYNEGSFTLNNSSVSSTGSAGSYGIRNSGTFTLEGSTVSATATSTAGSSNGYGIQNLAGTGTIDNSQISSSSNLTNYGIFNQATLNIQNSIISAFSNAAGANGLYNASGTVTINNSNISSTTDSSSSVVGAYGISVFGGTVNLANSVVSVNGGGQTTPFNVSGGTLNKNGGNVCKQNGVVVSC